MIQMTLVVAKILRSKKMYYSRDKEIRNLQKEVDELRKRIESLERKNLPEMELNLSQKSLYECIFGKKE